MNKLKVLAMNISKKNKIFRKIARKSMYVLKRTKYVLTGLNKKVPLQPSERAADFA